MRRMTLPAFFDQVPRLRVRDPLAERPGRCAATTSTGGAMTPGG